MRGKRPNDRGVTPVIAVVLMVAITVILASVVGTYTLSATNDVSDSSPNMAFAFEQKNITYSIRIGGTGGSFQDEFYTVNVVYEAGPPVDLDNIKVTMDAGPHPSDSGQAFWLDESDGGGDWDGIDLPFRGDGENPETLKPGDESGPLMLPYDPDNPKGRSRSIENIDTKNTVESYNTNYGTGGLTTDYGAPHTGFARPSAGTTVRVIWTKGTQKEVLAKHVIK
jgi:flagellin-like protein